MNLKSNRLLIGHFERTLALKTVLTGNNNLIVSGGYLGKFNKVTGKGDPVRKYVIENIKQAKDTFDGLKIDEHNYNETRNVDITAKADRLESISIDDIPIIDRVVNNEKNKDGSCDIFYGVGWSGHGWAISPTIAELLVEWAQTKQCLSLLKPFSSKRFNQRKAKNDDVCADSCCRSKL